MILIHLIYLQQNGNHSLKQDYFGHGVKVGPGSRNLGTWDLESLQSLKVGPLTMKKYIKRIYNNKKISEETEQKIENPDLIEVITFLDHSLLSNPF